MVSVIKKGYVLDFANQPFIDSFLVEGNRPSSYAHNNFISSEVKSLCAQGVLIQSTSRPTLLSPLHVVDNGKKLRLIHDLSQLNKFISPPKFKLDDYKSAWYDLCENSFAVSFDFRSGYHHIPVDSSSQQMLGLEWKGEYFSFAALPFGLSSAPYVFTKIFRVLVSKWRREGIACWLYLDDGIVLGRTEAECRERAAVVRRDLFEAGVLLAPEKCHWSPATVVDWLGFRVDLAARVISVSEARVSAALERIEVVRGAKSPTIRDRQVVLGTLNSMRLVLGDLVSLRSRFLEGVVAEAQRVSPLANNSKRSKTADESEELDFWIANLIELSTKQMLEERAFDFFIDTDASATGVGAVLTNRRGVELGRTSRDHGVGWDALSSTERELYGLLFALRTWGSKLERRKVRCNCDNQAAILIARKGSAKQSLHGLALSLYQISKRFHIEIVYFWIPRELNEVADELSREIDFDDWSIKDSLFRMCEDRWGRCSIDGFAAEDNTKCDRFFSKCPCPNTSGVDFFEALDDATSVKTLWLVPPPNLVRKCVALGKAYKIRAIIGMPDWPAHSSSAALKEGERWKPFVVDVLTYGPGAEIIIPGPGSARGQAFARPRLSFPFHFILVDFRR